MSQVIGMNSAVSMMPAREMTTSNTLFPGSIRKHIQKNIQVAVSEARTETLEDIGFSIGERLKAMEKSEKKTKPPVKETLLRVAETMPLSADLEYLFSQLESALTECDSQSELLHFLYHLFHDPALVALVVQSYLLKRKKNKKRLTPLLDELLGDLGDDASVVLFAALHFGSGNQPIKQQINRLYHESAKEFEGVVKFYKKLKQKIRQHKDRRKAVICLLHSFSEDIHDASDGIFKIKITYVINELKRLYAILGMDDECEKIARFMNHLPQVTYFSQELTLDTLVEWLDTAWIYTELVQSKLSELSIVTLSAQILFLQRMVVLFKKLPPGCFEDDDVRLHITDVLQQQIDELAVDEDV